jgi:hypothetical protein
MIQPSYTNAPSTRKLKGQEEHLFAVSNSFKQSWSQAEEPGPHGGLTDPTWTGVQGRRHMIRTCS